MRKVSSPKQVRTATKVSTPQAAGSAAALASGMHVMQCQCGDMSLSLSQGPFRRTTLQTGGAHDGSTVDALRRMRTAGHAVVAVQRVEERVAMAA